MIFNDSNDTIPTKWVWAKEGQLPLPFPTAFGSSIWLPKDITPQLGDSTRKYPWYSGGDTTYLDCAGVCVDKFYLANGITKDQLTNPLGVPPCCAKDQEDYACICFDSFGTYTTVFNYSSSACTCFTTTNKYPDEYVALSKLCICDRLGETQTTTSNYTSKTCICSSASNTYPAEYHEVSDLCTCFDVESKITTTFNYTSTACTCFVGSNTYPQKYVAVSDLCTCCSASNNYPQQYVAVSTACTCFSAGSKNTTSIDYKSTACTCFSAGNTYPQQYVAVSTACTCFSATSGHSSKSNYTSKTCTCAESTNEYPLTYQGESTACTCFDASSTFTTSFDYVSDICSCSKASESIVYEYLYAASGALKVSGSASMAPKYSYSPSGGLKLYGSATATQPSGGSTVSNSCCSNIPTTLYATFSNVSGLSCLDGVKISLTYNSGGNLWTNNVTLCGASVIPQLTCFPPWHWAGIGNANQPTYTCSPWSLSFSNVNAVVGSTSGTINITITES